MNIGEKTRRALEKKFQTGRWGKPPRPLAYPIYDGNTMALSSLQWRIIALIAQNLESLFEGRADVWVGKDQFWYPDRLENRSTQAPDVFVVFGVQNYDRIVYQQWKESGTPPQVVIEVLSTNNRAGEMNRKYEFYRRHGVEEYYIIDPDFRLVKTGIEAYIREAGDVLWKHITKFPFVSPRLNVIFTVEEDKICYYRPDGTSFRSYAEQERQAKAERARAEAAERRADEERARAEAERARAEIAERRAEELAALLRKLGYDPE